MGVDEGTLQVIDIKEVLMDIFCPIVLFYGTYLPACM